MAAVWFACRTSCIQWEPFCHGSDDEHVFFSSSELRFVVSHADVYHLPGSVFFKSSITLQIR